MAKDLDDLERDAQRTARELAGTQPQASSKLRDALSSLQQDEVKLRMKYSANWIRQGKGSMMVTSEAVSNMAINKMRDQIKEAQAAAEKNGDKQPGGGKQDETSKALAQVERLREQLERAAQGQRGQRGGQQQDGQQGGQQQGGQQQGGQQQGGQQQGGQQQGGPAARRSTGRPATRRPASRWRWSAAWPDQPGWPQCGRPARGIGSLNRGDLPQRSGDAPINRPAGDGGDSMERTIRETMRDLSQLRQELGGATEMGRQISDFMRDLQTTYALQGPALTDRLQKEVLPAMEQMELQLRRKLDSENGGQVRNPTAERVPAGYSDKVADYFRRLSGGKK